MNNHIIGTHWKVLYDLPFSRPIIFTFVDAKNVMTDSGTQYKWEVISDSLLKIYIPEYVSLYANLYNGDIVNGTADSDYTNMNWTWTCEKYNAPRDPIIGPIPVSDILNGKWVIVNKVDAPDNELTFNADKTIDSKLYGKGKWNIRQDENGKEVLNIETAQGFIRYTFQIADEKWRGKAVNELGDKWEASFIHTLIITPVQKEPKPESKPKPASGISSQLRKEDAILISQYLNEVGITCFYHFTDKKNLDSIRTAGGLFSWDYCERNNINIPRPGGDELSRSLDKKYNLQDYVRLSFCKDHPMKHICMKSNRISQPEILIVSTEVAEFESTLFSDMNAADKQHSVGNNIDFLKKIDHTIFLRHYHFLSDHDKKKYQAEILVKTSVPIKYITNINSL